MWAEILGGSIIAFISGLFGVRVSQAKLTTKLESIEKLIESQGVAMGREIGELKTEVKTIRDDFYKPRVGK